MSATEILELVYRLMPVAFFADLLVFTFGLWWVRKVRA